MTDDAAVASRSYPHASSIFADPERLRDDFERFGNVWSLVAESDGRIVGHVAFLHAHTHDEPRAPIPGLAHVWRVFVAPEHWGTGLARELLRRAHAGMRERGYTRARLYTPKSQLRARAFYEREGWRPTGEQDYSDWLQLELVEYRLDL